MKKHPTKWRETMDPFTLHFRNFHLQDVLGYPHAGNDVFHVRGTGPDGSEIKAFLKVERQRTADIEREVLIINQLDLPFLPTVLDYSFSKPKYILTKEMEGRRLSDLLEKNQVLESLKYMDAYGELLAKVHSIQMDPFPVKPRKFKLPHEFYLDNYHLKEVGQYLEQSKFEDTKCFIHGDCHYANILWKNGEVSCLLDYELSGHGSREYDLAWALTLRPGQKFLKTKREKEAFLDSYNKYHQFSKKAFDYYMVLIGVFFYSISSGIKNEDYRNHLFETIGDIINN